VQKFLKAFSWSLALLFSAYAGSAMAVDLFSAEAPLDSASEADVKATKRQAMASMIVRLTGQQASLKNGNIVAALTDVDTYISHISRQTDTDTDEVRLQLRFDQQMVRQLINAAELPVWGSERLSTMTWLVIEQQGIQNIIADGSLDLRLPLQADAEQRSLPLLLPLMDLTDQLVIGPSDIWGNFTDTIMLASQRYQAKSLLWGRLFQNTEGFWQGQGSIQVQGEQVDWLFAAPNPEALVTLIIENLGAELSQRFALPSATDQEYLATLHINGIADLAAYAEVRSLLQQNPSVTAVTLQRLQGDQLVILVNYQGSQDNLLLSLERQESMVLLDGQLETLYSSELGPVAYFQWQ
jgi:hypothetical protein